MLTGKSIYLFILDYEQLKGNIFYEKPENTELLVLVSLLKLCLTTTANEMHDHVIVKDRKTVQVVILTKHEVLIEMTAAQMKQIVFIIKGPVHASQNPISCFSF